LFDLRKFEPRTEADEGRNEQFHGGLIPTWKRSDRSENSFPMAERNAQFFQIGFGYIGQDLEIDSIFGKDGCELGEAYPIKPSQYLVIGAHDRVLFPSRNYSSFLFKSSR
jgi:hypothetical protein